MPEHSENNECAGCDNCDFLPYDIFLMGGFHGDYFFALEYIGYVYSGMRAGVGFPALFVGVILRTSRQKPVLCRTICSLSVPQGDDQLQS